MKTVIVQHSDCYDHQTPAGHPEQVARLQAVMDGLAPLELEAVKAPLATDAQLLLAHTADYLKELVNSNPSEGYHQIDADTLMSPGTLQAARRSAGAGLLAVDLVLENKANSAFVATRPPGHHAEPDKAMGFCLFGNAALAARHALGEHGLNRVAIVDFDVHHGNGTQAILRSEPRTLVISSHQFPLWPGSGYPEDTGEFDNILNVPLLTMSGGVAMRDAYQRMIFPRLRHFRPQLIIVSAGFDAHQKDPIAQLEWYADDYSWIAREIIYIAQELCEGRVVSILEGGYNLEALSASVYAYVAEFVKA
ncbi:MAG: histone deacetylase family protein [Aestuariivita sp.]|nr:histone deacetylase family protein [Aestuariivita sp.]MCY4202373.1 histone deacetylase family protein [Aestuariivita sp.]MCY4288349.1 histone deacetylase family protein [Aestuariivita sp.]MCY4346406.1 histone deacetylase family protein [Aestuariivita sp.]